MKKERYAAWANLTATVKPAPKSSQHPPIRILDLPGFRDVEAKVCGTNLISLEADYLIQELSKKTFGITQSETEFEEIDDDWDQVAYDVEWEKHEALYETARLPVCDAVPLLLELGFDFTDDYGLPLHCTKLFMRQAEAAAKGIKGCMPDRTVLGLETWESRLQAQADSFKAGKRAGRR